MMSGAWTATRNSFDSLAEQAQKARQSFDEEELLRDSHWRLGQDARLREDIRFRSTPWGRWIYSTAYLANDFLFTQLHHEPHIALKLDKALTDLDKVVKRRCVFCKGDPRFVLDGETVRLSARELGKQPLIEPEAEELHKFVTHLPVHSLRAAAASMPEGEWGTKAHEENIEVLGWIRVSISRKLNPRMFVAQIEGKSMDDGQSGLVDGGYTVFELWPAGNNQNLNVLVRGSFSDPETGSYAVKKFVTDERDEDGRHHRITLVSLNPDKERYPDIELEVGNDEDVRVVAKVVQALSPDQFARKPRPARKAGRRDISSSESINEIFTREKSQIEKFFEDLPGYDDDDAVEKERSRWSAQIVCLDAEAGGLHVEIGPLIGLWSFIKQLRICGESWETSIPASNARFRPVRIEVPPGAGPWRWEAVGFEDEPDIDFSSLNLAPLPPDSAVAFKVDSAGIGRFITSRKLSEGGSYRILFPDNVMVRLESKPPTFPLKNGWQLWDADLSSPIEPEVHILLRELGFETGEQAARLDWAIVPPVQWCTSPRGLDYPCFLAEPAPVLSVSGPGIDVDGEAGLFLCGPDGHQKFSLSAGGQRLVQLEGLSPGIYSALLLFDRTGIAYERIFFKIIDTPPMPVQADWEIRIGSESAHPVPGTTAVIPAGDIADPSETTALHFQFKAPPGWPVRVSWKVISEDYLLTTYTDQNGRVDTDNILAITRDRRAHSSIANMILDLAELGAAVVRHDRKSSPDAIRSRIEELVSTRGASVQDLAGSYISLLKKWFEPVCSLLGYDMEMIILPEESEPPEHIAVFRLLHTERKYMFIEKQPARLLILVKDLPRELSETLQTWLDGICHREGLRDILISDGLRWAPRRRGSSQKLVIYDLSVVTKNESEFLSFLHVASEGI